jgi:peptidoglycan/xylan/chitin deacetylase (PgdA/CDA1 family)
MQKYFSAVAVNLIILLTLTILIGVATFGDEAVAVSSSGGEAIYNGNREGNTVTLMINVYWGTEYVLDIAEIIEQYGFKTTFFVGGSWADDNNDIVKKLYNMGFEIGNHGYFHKKSSSLSYQGCYDEIIANEKLLKGILGVEPVKLFAPPSGDLGSNMFKLCKDQGYKVIMWSRDTIDWRDKDSTLVYKRAVKDIKGGDLILMHPTAHTLEALPKILDTVKASGLKVGTVSENLTPTV